MNLRQTHPTKASAAQPSMKGDPKQARGLWALATFIVLLLISTIVYVGAPSPTAGAQNSNFARSSQVELGNFWNPEGVIYGYNASWTPGPSGNLAQVSFHDSTVEPDVSISQLFSGGYFGNFNQGTWNARIATMRAIRDNGIIPMYATGTPGGSDAIDHMVKLANGDPATEQLVRQWAYQLQEADLGPLFIRLAHEGDRTDREWIKTQQPEVYVNWFRAFHDIVETPVANFDGENDFEGLDNVIWAWTPAEFGFKFGITGNTGGEVPLEQTRSNLIYPGADYVDWIGTSGYDFPCSTFGGNPDNLHQDDHAEVIRRFGEWADRFAPDKPAMMAEWGSTPSPDNPNTGLSRATWFDTTREMLGTCLLYTSPSPRDATLSRMPSSA